MNRSLYAGTRVFAALCAAVLLQATTLQRLSFEELTDTSDSIVTGKVTRTWTAWDSSHSYIWTHYEVAVAATHKGNRATTVQLSEPGGAADGMVMTVAGSVAYRVGDEVMVFLQTMPNGLVRTTGWGQGKYAVDNHGRLHAEVAARGVDYVEARSTATPTSQLDGLTIQEASLRIAARLRASQRTGGGR